MTYTRQNLISKPNQELKHVFMVPVKEYEKGWGNKIDDYMVCTSEKDCEAFISEFNAKNNLDHAPDWYMRASANLSSRDISTHQFNSIVSSPNKRMWLSELKDI